MKKETSADLVVYGKIFTSENDQIAEAFAVKDGRYVYVGDRQGAAAFIEEALAGAPDDPFGILEIAVTGVLQGENGKPWWPEELISREQALNALTIACAKQLFVENERGSIREGKYADFLLVDKDVLSCPVNEIHSARPAATYFEGKKVFSV